MPIDLRNLTRAPGLVLGPEVVVVADPMAVAETGAAIADLLDGGGKRRCAWFDSYLSGGASGRVMRVSPVGETPTYMGRTCCYQHMRDMEHRLPSLPLPHETTCPECRRVFRFQLGLRARR